MSSRPRRPSEWSASKQTGRQSRIAVPTRTRSRGASLERYSLAGNSNLCPPSTGSTLKPKRSNSATPLKTPTRPIPTSGVISTNEKERAPLDNKKWLQEQAARVTEYLYVIEAQLGQDFFQRGGLKSMSTKQFVIIINHFLKFIAGARFTIGFTNYVDEIVKVLTQIHYPYTVNKSSLKTLTAPHSFSHVVVLLSWLFSFVTTEESIEHFESEVVMEDEDLLDLEFTTLFTRQVADGFALWNNNKDEEFELLKRGLMNTFIQKQTEVQDLTTIEHETKRLYEEYDHLRNHKVIVRKEGEFLKLDMEIKTKKKALAKLEDLCKDSSNKLEHVKQLYESKIKLTHTIQNQISELKEKIESQKISMKGRDVLIAEISKLKNHLESKKEFIYMLQNEISTKQIQIARLMNKKLELVPQLNTYICKIFSDPLNSIPNLQDICLDGSDEDTFYTQVDNLIPILEKVKDKNNQIIIEYTKTAVDLKNNLSVAINEHNLLEQQLAEILQSCQVNETEMEKLDAFILEKRGQLMKEIDDLKLELKKCNSVIEKLSEEIQHKEIELVAVRSENKAMVDRTLSRGNEIMDEKEDNLNKLSDAVTSLQNTIREVKVKIKDPDESDI